MPNPNPNLNQIQTPNKQPSTSSSNNHDRRRPPPARRRRTGDADPDPVRDPQHGPRHAGAGLRHRRLPRARRPAGHHPARRAPRLPPPRHGRHVRHGAGRGRRRRRGRALRRRAVARGPLRHLQARDPRRAPGPRRAGAPRLPRPPRPRLPRPLPRPLARRRRRPRGQEHAHGVRHGGRVARHGGVPPPGPGALRRRQQLLGRQDGAAAGARRRAPGREPGGAQRGVEAGQGAGGVREARRGRGRLLAAGRVRRLMGLGRRHAQRRHARRRRRQSQDRGPGGVEVGVRAGRVLCGEELQQGEAQEQHGHLRLGAERGGQGHDRHDTAEKGVPGGLLCVARRTLQITRGAVGRRDMNDHSNMSSIYFVITSDQVLEHLFYEKPSCQKNELSMLQVLKYVELLNFHSRTCLG